MTTITYNRFKIKTDDASELAHLKNVVDVFNVGNKCSSIAKCMRVDAARIAMAHRGACRMLRPMSFDQHNWLQMTLGLNVASVDSALMPNRIEAKHMTRGSRVRNLLHGGMLGLLAVRLMHDPSQVERTSRTHDSACIIQRVNGQSGCEHVKWSIPEFQFIHNMSAKYFRNSRNPFITMSHDEALSQLNLLDTPENRQAFMEECKALANAPNHSRIKRRDFGCHDDDVCVNDWWCCRFTTAMVIPDEWIARFLAAFSRVCSLKMGNVSDNSESKINRSMSLVDVFRFISSRIDWILTDPNLRQIANMHRFWEKYMERISFMAGEGVEHAALMMAKYAPEMMTPELHCVVNPVADVYRVPEMQISNDDELFAPLKAACQALLPAAVPMPAPTQLHRNRIYSDSEDDDYYHDYYDNECDDDDNECDDDDNECDDDDNECDDDDNAQG